MKLATAYQMWSKGSTVEKIAKETELDIETIEWFIREWEAHKK